MAKGFTGEILHFGAVRMRVTGSGDLQLALSGLDDYNLTALPELSMQVRTNLEPLVLADFKDQRGSLKGYVDTIDNYFQISKITVFIRPIATGYPQ